MLIGEGLGEKQITYMKHVMPHGYHIYAKAYDMENATMYVYPQSDHSLPHWKYFMQRSAKFTRVNILDQETDDQYSNKSPSISFHIYHLITRCKTHGRLLLNDKKICLKCKQDTASEQSTKIYTRKELVMMETTISNFHTSFYIPEIQKLAFHIPLVQVLDKNHFFESCRTAFECRK